MRRKPGNHEPGAGLRPTAPGLLTIRPYGATARPGQVVRRPDPDIGFRPSSGSMRGSRAPRVAKDHASGAEGRVKLKLSRFATPGEEPGATRKMSCTPLVGVMGIDWGM